MEIKGVTKQTLFILIFITALFLSACQTEAPTPTENASEYVALVNGEAITRDMVEAELKISRLNVHNPLPPLKGENLKRATEEAVNQLITRHLILQAAAQDGFALNEATIAQQADILFGGSGDTALEHALTTVGASRADLLWWVGEISTVQAYTVEVIMASASPEERQDVYNAWINARQATAEVQYFLDGKAENAFTALAESPAPNFTLHDINGQPISLSDYRGQTVLINFWATWCPSCLAEMPEYEQVYQDLGHGEADFMALAVNLQEKPEQVEPFISGLGITFPILLDPEGDITNSQYQIIGMPGSVIVDKEGIIFYRHIGPMSGETLRQKLAELEE